MLRICDNDDDFGGFGCPDCGGYRRFKYAHDPGAVSATDPAPVGISPT